MQTSASEAPIHVIMDRTVRFPVEVRDASSGSASFLVPTAAAARYVPADFEPAEFLPGRALLTLVMVDYRDNDLGDYDEMAVAYMVRPRGQRPRLPWLGSWAELLSGGLATHITHMPVDQPFTREAGERLWGYPKTLQQIEIELTEDRARGRLVYDGEHALTLSVPRGGGRTVEGGEITTLSLIEGVPHRTRAAQRLAGMGMRLGGAEVELGSGPVADELRALGLPKRALMCTWVEHMSARFEPAEKL